MKRGNDEVNVEYSSSKEIRNIVKEIRESKLQSKERIIYFEKKYPEFAKQFGILIEMASEPDFDVNRFNYMMDMRDRIAEKKETEESASVKVGQVLFNEFVQPVIDKK
jgi:hypothetical protein